ncbi:DUF3299 domain-containing protein [Pontibacter sp. SGAir0037]|nr:DUF3299 domain-containing protein [Pontibacter sp. SGAir0037]
MKKILGLVFVLCLFIGAESQAQQKISWEQLQDVKFKRRYNATYDAFFHYPVFGNKVKALEGKDVILTGYMIPLDVAAGMYALSAVPYSMCFFCGGAGPESVLGLIFKKPGRRYRTDEYISFRGTFRLNAADVENFNYILEEAVLVPS